MVEFRVGDRVVLIKEVKLNIGAKEHRMKVGSWGTVFDLLGGDTGTFAVIMDDFPSFRVDHDYWISRSSFRLAFRRPKTFNTPEEAEDWLDLVAKDLLDSSQHTLYDPSMEE